MEKYEVSVFLNIPDVGIRVGVIAKNQEEAKSLIKNKFFFGWVDFQNIVESKHTRKYSITDIDLCDDDYEEEEEDVDENIIEYCEEEDSIDLYTPVTLSYTDFFEPYQYDKIRISDIYKQIEIDKINGFDLFICEILIEKAETFQFYYNAKNGNLALDKAFEDVDLDCIIHWNIVEDYNFPIVLSEDVKSDLDLFCK